MARVLSEGSGPSGSKGSADNATVLSSTDDTPVHLPQGIDASSLEMSRDGQNLVLQSPDGQTFIIENYFLAADAPVIVSANGALLSPAMVQSFLGVHGDVQVAALQSTSDASPVGEVTEVTGKASVTHADGTKEAITSGTKIFEGDIVETDAKGAVNITFADESTFAVSENARLAIDDFSFNAADQSGTTGLSILRGVFMFTSGLIGRENPDAVHLETPVGSIGIRGTIIGGNIHEGHAQISVIEGAIVVRNGTGEQILSGQFETVQLTGFNAPISNIGQLDAQHMGNSYNAVRSVSQTLFTSIDDTAHDNQPQSANPPAGNEPPATEATPEPVAPPALDDRPIFQELNTGSNIESPLGASQVVVELAPPPAPLAPPPAAPVAAAPQPPAPPAIEDNGDRRPPSTVTFISGGTVDENSAIGTIVGTVVTTASQGFPVSYSLINNPGNQFAINAATGLITLAATGGDYDTGTTHYHLDVRATRTDTGQFTDTPLSVGVLNVDEAPTFGTGNLNGDEGAAILLTTATIGATDPDHTTNLTYTVTHQQKGNIQVNGTNASSFTQADLDANIVTFRHDGSEPGSGVTNFTLVATDAANNASDPHVVTVSVTNVNDQPVLTISEGGSIAEGSTTVLTTSMLSWSDSDTPALDVQFTISTPSRGQLQKYNGTTWDNVNGGGTFSQQDIVNGKVRFVHDGLEGTPASFGYSVTDGMATPQSGSVNFSVTPVNDAPVGSGSSPLNVIEGEAIAITTANLQFTDAESSASGLTYTIVSTNHGSVEYTANSGASWTALGAGNTFTQHDINNGKIRFHHNGDEASTAQLVYTLSDGTATIGNQTLSLAVTNTNDAASIDTPGPAALDERSGPGSPQFVLAALTINDGEPVNGSSPYTFVVQKQISPGTYADDSRFDVVFTGGAWKLVAKADIAFDHEAEASVILRVTLTDGSNAPVTTGDLTVTITDVNEPATAFSLNEGQQYRTDGSNYVDGLVQGRSPGASLGVLSSEDPDVGALHANAAQYHVTAFSMSGGVTGLTAADFRISDITDDGGNTHQILQLNPSTAIPASGSGTITVALTLDANNNAVIGDAGDITHSYTFQVRNDTMLLESVNGKNGFHIDNDSRFALGGNGANFAASMAAGDFDGDGRVDLLFGAPSAFNGEGTPEQSGGVYIFKGGTPLMDNAQNGIVNLSAVTNASGNGAFHELSTGSNDAGSYYGAQVAVLRRFDGTSGADLVVTNPGDGTVEIIRNGNVGTTTTITGIPTDGITGPALAKSITATSIGDLNGDGYSDLLIGAPLGDTNGTNAGQIGIFYGSATPASTYVFSAANIILKPEGTGAGFGSTVTGVGDIDGDGYSDFAVTAPNVDTNSAAAGSNQGRVFLYFGSANPDSATNLPSEKMQIVGTIDQDKIGSTMSSAGDFNGDGLNDLMIGSNLTDSGRGAVYLLFGDPALKGHGTTAIDQLNTAANFNGVKIHWAATDPNVHVGDSFTRAGDFNGDGFDDVVIDTSRSLGSGQYEHTLYVLYGTTSGGTYNLDDLTMNESAAFKIRLLEPTGQHLTLSSGGDINGDGFDDIIVGNPNEHNGDSTTADGGATVVYGGNYDGEATMITTSASATAAGQSFVGDSGANILNSNGQQNLSYRGGDGSDTMNIDTLNAVHSYKGGAGSDKLQLFFSGDETVTPATDFIDLRGLGGKVSGVENIVFALGSKQDTLKLDIHDILQMASSSETHSLTISLSETPAGGDENHLTLYNGVSAAGSLSGLTGALAFTNDVDSNGQDTRNVGGVNYYVYTNQSSGTELLVDSRISEAAVL